MARPLRIEYEGAHYYVTSRGNERKAIFRDNTDREKFLQLIGQVQVYLFLLDTLRRADRVKELLDLWSALRARNDLTVIYRSGSRAAKSEFVVAGLGLRK
jgi:hypothetical protein